MAPEATYAIGLSSPPRLIGADGSKPLNIIHSLIESSQKKIGLGREPRQERVGIGHQQRGPRRSTDVNQGIGQLPFG